MKRVILFLILSFLPMQQWGEIVFNFSYTDPEGRGFNNPAYSKHKRDLEEVGKELGGWLDHDATINVEVRGDVPVGSEHLYGAYAQGYCTGTGDGLYLNNVQKKIIYGISNITDVYDAKVVVDLGNAKLSGGAKKSDKTGFDFKSVMKHELTHLLGFGSEALCRRLSSGVDSMDRRYRYNLFDLQLVDEDGNELLDEHGRLRANFDAKTAVYFDGPNVRKLFGGPVAIYSPEIYESGSSYSHLKEEDAMMLPETNISKHIPKEWHNIERAILEDLGYKLRGRASIPTSKLPRTLRAVFLRYVGDSKHDFLSHIEVKHVCTEYQVDELEGYQFLGVMDYSPESTELDLSLKNGTHFKLNTSSVGIVDYNVSLWGKAFLLRANIDQDAVDNQKTLINLEFLPVTDEVETAAKENEVPVYAKIFFHGGTEELSKLLAFQFDNKKPLEVNLPQNSHAKLYLGHGDKYSVMRMFLGDRQIAKIHFNQVVLVREFEQAFKIGEGSFVAKIEVDKKSLSKPKLELSIVIQKIDKQI